MQNTNSYSNVVTFNDRKIGLNPDNCFHASTVSNNYGKSFTVSKLREIGGCAPGPVYSHTFKALYEIYLENFHQELL